MRAMFGRRSLPVAKEASKGKLETMIIRKPLDKRMNLFVMRRWAKKLIPLDPLKFKLQALPKPDTTWNTPLGNTEHLPFHVQRTSTNNLPVYTDFTYGDSKKLTIIRKVTGDMHAIKEELIKITSNSEVIIKHGKLEVKGLHSAKIKKWLRCLGF